MRRTTTLFSVCLLLALLLVACQSPSAAPLAAAPTLDAAALDARETALALTQAALDATLTPTSTPSPTASATPTQTPIPPSATPTATPTPSYEDFVRSARILLHEDVVQSYGLAEPYIAQALEQGGYAYETTDGLIGHLKKQIDDDWDLVIVAAEMKADVQGEFFLYLNRRLRQGSAVILETWLLDKVYTNKFSYMLDACGLQVQGDYTQSTDRGVRWVDPAHPLLQVPHAGIELTDFIQFWGGDLGDLLRKTPAEQTAFTSPADFVGSLTGATDQGGLLTTCLDGRFILQTFSTHDHKQEDMVALWQNYIAYALKARYAYLQAQAAQPPNPVNEFREEAIIHMFPFNFSPIRTMLKPWRPFYEVLTLDQQEVNTDYLPAGQVDLLLAYEHSITSLPGYTNYIPFLLNSSDITALQNHYQSGVVVILEKTLFNENSNRTYSQRLLADCGVKLLDDYTVGQLRPEMWLVGPEHPFFQGPNAELAFTRRPTADRLGVLLQRLPEAERQPGIGQTEFLAGVDPALTGGVENGFITSCQDGRFILVTLASSAYDDWAMFRLWENLIDYGLRIKMAEEKK